MFSSFRLLQNESAATKDTPGAKAGVVSFFLGLVGFFVSLYAFATHLKASVSGQSLSCDISDMLSCSKAYTSGFGEIGGIPLGAFGMSYFGIVMAAAIVPKFTDVSESWARRWQLIVSAVGFAVSLILVYISITIIKSFCPVCTTVHSLTFLNFVVCLVTYLKVKNQPQFAHPQAFLKFVSTSLAFATPALLAGVLVPSFAPLIFKSSDTVQAAPTAAAAASSSATPFPQEIIGVAKNNFVGKGEDFRKGNDDARVVLQMWSDFQCPACRMASKSIDATLEQYGKDKVLFVYRNYPLSNSCNPHMTGNMHPHACILAHAARCAGQQGKFWEFKEWAFEGQDWSDGDKATAYSKDGLTNQAGKLGLDSQRFRACLDSTVELAKIKDDSDKAQQMGITGTPMIIINGYKYTGDWRNPEAFIAEFERRLQK